MGRPSTDPFLLPRVKIAYRDDVWGFFYRLASALASANAVRRQPSITTLSALRPVT